MELEQGTNFTPTIDKRRFIPPPPPVALATIEDAELPATTGLEAELDRFYVNLLQLERDERYDGVCYKAENFRLIFRFTEGFVPRDDMRMLGVVVRSLGDTMRKLIESEIEFERERGLTAGEERLVLLDPAGNWIRITQSKAIM
jgi:hypothetical protein